MCTHFLLFYIKTRFYLERLFSCHTILTRFPLQVFSPKEAISSPLVLHLIFCQIVGDMFNKFHSIHARISADEREEMLDVSIAIFVEYSY